MDTFLTDLRLGARSLLRTPMATSVALLSLALGIAVVTTLFTAVDGFVLRPLDAPEPDDLVAVYGTNQDRGWTQARISIPDILDYRGASRTVDLAGYRDRDVNISGTTEPEQLPGIEATANIFEVLGVAPALGRGFLPEEERDGEARVAVLGFGLWTERFGSDPGVIGRTINLEGRPVTVVGVMPMKSPLPFNMAAVWFPSRISGEEDRAGRSWSVIGRLQNDSELEEARSEMSRIAVGLAESYPGSNAGMGVNLISFRQDLFGDDPRTGSLILLTAGMLVLLIACANVISLLLARAIKRERELAVRAALGASRRRLVRQLLTESVLLGVAGGVLGVILAVAGVRGLLMMLPPIFADIIYMSGRVLVFTTATAVAAGILVGVAPALQSSKADLRTSLSDGGTRGGSAGIKGGRFRRGLVVSQLSLALVLLVTSGLLVQSLMAVRTIDVGFQPSNLLTFNTRLPESGYPDDESIQAFYGQLVSRLEAIPGVESVSASSTLPMSGGQPQSYYTVVGEDHVEGEEPVSSYRDIAPGYFRTLGIPLVQGRGIGMEDGPSAAPVVVVNRAFVERHWPQGEALGQRVKVGDAIREVVGVVGNVRLNAPTSAHRPVLYMSAAQQPHRTMTLVLRTATAPMALTAAARRAVTELDPDQPIFHARSMDEMIADTLVGEIIMPRIAGFLAAFALLLSIIGVYGVMAHTVALRTRETGIRIALGATPRAILATVVGQGAKMLILGVGIGTGLALLAAQGLASQLYGVNAFDLPIFALTPMVLLGAGLVAAFLPARRATQVDPVKAMQAE
jgi:putative ABC transport system permease protein